MNNRLSTRVWLEILAMAAVCIVAFVVMRERTNVNAIAITKNAEAIQQLVDFRFDDRETIIAMQGDIKSISTNLTKIERKIQ